MLTPEHFSAQQQIIQSAKDLVLAVAARRKVETILHIVFDPKVKTTTRDQEALLRKVK